MVAADRGADDGVGQGAVEVAAGAGAAGLIQARWQTQWSGRQCAAQKLP